MDLFGKKAKAELEETKSQLETIANRLYNVDCKKMDLEGKYHEVKVQNNSLSKIVVNQREQLKTYRKSGFGELYGGYVDRICEWADKRGLNYVTDKQVIKLQEEVGELAEAHNKHHDDDLKDSLGDIYVVITIIAYQHGWNIEDLIAASYNVIKDRKGKNDNGTFIKTEDIHD